MCSRKELDSQLDQIPPSYKYELIANLREAHRLFHLGLTSEESSRVEVVKLDELEFLFNDFKNTDFGEAIKLIDRAAQITEDHIGDPGNGKAMELLTQIYNKHCLQGNINHAF